MRSNKRTLNNTVNNFLNKKYVIFFANPIGVGGFIF